jgi:cytochrome b involved in lipid metabolism
MIDYNLLKTKYAPNIIMVINNNVYDVTEFSKTHPGGADILEKYKYEDATDAYNDVGHSIEANRILKNYLIGPYNILIKNNEDSNQEKRLESNKSDKKIITILISPVFKIIILLFVVMTIIFCYS